MELVYTKKIKNLGQMIWKLVIIWPNEHMKLKYYTINDVETIEWKYTYFLDFDAWNYRDILDLFSKRLYTW